MVSLLQKKLEDDLTAALKDRDNPQAKLRLDVLRLLISSLKNKRIDTGADLSDAEILTLIQKAVKEREDSISMYTKGGREELAKKEEDEITILRTYLPEGFSKEEVNEIIAKVIAEKGPFDQKSFGRAMNEVLTIMRLDNAKLVDAAIVSQILKEKLS
jgi:uncharacterized protein YqeY